MADTKEQILDAAETLFAEHGVEAVPLRRIISHAGVNAAAIHYHFGPKEKLVHAVFARRFNPLNRMRMVLLDEVEQAAGDGAPVLENILKALVEPAFRVGQETGSGKRFRALAGRLLTERPGYLAVLFDELFKDLELRVDDLVRRALPDLPEKELQWRKHMAIGTMVFVLREQEWISQATGGLCDTSDVDGATRRVVDFMVAGMKGPMPSEETSGHRKSAKDSRLPVKRKAP